MGRRCGDVTEEDAAIRAALDSARNPAERALVERIMEERAAPHDSRRPAIRHQVWRRYMYVAAGIAAAVAVWWWRIHDALRRVGQAAWMWIALSFLGAGVALGIEALVSAAVRRVRSRRRGRAEQNDARRSSLVRR